MVKINNITKYPELPFEFTLDSTEEFKKGAIKLDNLTQQTPFDDYSVVDITINDIDYSFILESDLPNRVAKDITTHQITLLEEVVKLNDVMIPDRAFTTTQGVQTTWKYQLETIIETSDLDYTVQSSTMELLNVKANNQQYSGSFLNFLVIAFRAVDAIPTLSGTVIGHNLLNERKNNITTEVQTILDNDSMESRRYEANINDYASSVYSKVKNGSYEEEDEIGATYFPSKNNYVTVRSSDNKYDDNNAEIQFNNGIRRITTAIINLDVSIARDVSQGTFGSTGDLPATADVGDYYTCDMDGYVSTVAGLTFDTGDKATYFFDKWEKNLVTTDVNRDVDMTDYVVVKEAWDKYLIATDSATIKTTLCQNNSFYYTEGGNKLENIGNEYDLGLFATPTAYRSMIEALEQKYTINISNLVTKNKLINANYRFKYIPASDYDTDVERHTSNRVKIKSVKTNQQQESRVELGKLGKANYQYVNRMGNDRFEITVRYFDSDPYDLGLNTYDDIWELNDYYNGYKIVKQKFIVDTNRIDVTYLFVANQSNLNPNSAFTNPVSPYTIQDKIQAETCFVRKHYAVFGDYLPDNTLNIKTKRTLWNRFDYLASYDKPIYSAVYSSTDADENILLPVQRAIEGRGFTFNTQFDSKTVAGSKIEVTPSTAGFGHKLTPINYTNDYGEVENCVIYYCNEVNLTPTDYPVANSFNITFGNYTRTVKLQPNEILGETTRIECVTDRENLFIYKKFLLYNSLVREIDEDSTLRVYYYDKPLFTTDTQTLPSGEFTSELVTVSLYKLTLSGTYLGFSYAIVDDATDELYFAYNNYGDDLLEINMSLRATNPNLTGEFDVNEFNITLLDTLSLESESVETDYIFPIIGLGDALIVTDEMTIIKSTNYEVELNDVLLVSSIARDTNFVFPREDIESTINQTDTITVIKSTDYDVTLNDTLTLSSLSNDANFEYPVLSFSDRLSISSEIAIYTAITGYVVNLSASIELEDTLTVIKSTDYDVSLSDTLVLTSLSTDYRSTNLEISLTDTLSTSSTITQYRSTDYDARLTDTLSLGSTINDYISTDYVIDLSDTLSLSSTIESSIPIEYTTSINDTISLSSTISDAPTVTRWELITSSTYDEAVTYVSSGSLCVSQITAKTWLDTNYPATDYAYGYIMRVVRANENLSPCTPSAYYYQAL